MERLFSPFRRKEKPPEIKEDEPVESTEAKLVRYLELLLHDQLSTEGATKDESDEAEDKTVLRTTDDMTGFVIDYYMDGNETPAHQLFIRPRYNHDTSHNEWEVEQRFCDEPDREPEIFKNRPDIFVVSLERYFSEQLGLKENPS